MSRSPLYQIESITYDLLFSNSAKSMCPLSSASALRKMFFAAVRAYGKPQLSKSSSTSSRLSSESPSARNSKRPRDSSFFASSGYSLFT